MTSTFLLHLGSLQHVCGVFSVIKSFFVHLGIERQTQAFLSLVLPDLEKSGPRARDPAKEKQVREAAEWAIKEIRTYGFEVK